MADDTSGVVTRVASTFPLSNWVKLAEFWGDGMPLPRGVDWDAYTVELIERLLTKDDLAAGILTFGPSLSWEGGTFTRGINPDGSLRHLEMNGGQGWRHVRTVISHADVAAKLEWRRDGSPLGQIAIVGLEEDPDPELSCLLLAKAVPLLRDYEWQGQRKPGRPELTDDLVRRDLAKALERCRRKGWPRPSLRQLADQHDRPYDPASDEEGLSETAIRDRMDKHPGPFRDLVPWIHGRHKK